MSLAESSLRILKLGGDNLELCALPSCDEAALDFPCTGCNDAPDPDFSGTPLEDVRSCCEAHGEQDADDHKDTCRHRRWLRDGARIGDFYHKIFIAARKEMYERVLVRQEKNYYVQEARNFVFRNYTKPASKEAFCGTDVNEENKHCTLSLDGCVYGVQIATPFLAYRYITKGTPTSLNSKIKH